MRITLRFKKWLPDLGSVWILHPTVATENFLSAYENVCIVIAEIEGTRDEVCMRLVHAAGLHAGQYIGTLYDDEVSWLTAPPAATVEAIRRGWRWIAYL